MCALDPEVPQLRLVSGGDRCAGRVEVYHDGKWGTVCDDHFSMNSGNVVCRQLDCGYAVSVTESSRFGSGEDDIHLDDVKCHGTESYLWDCPHSGWSKHNCGHHEDIGVICSGKKKKKKCYVFLKMSLALPMDCKYNKHQSRAWKSDQRRGQVEAPCTEPGL